MNRRNDFLTHHGRETQRPTTPHEPYSSNDAPRSGRDPHPGADSSYGVGVSHPQGGYVDRAARRQGNGDAYQQVRPWGPQEGVDGYRQERSGAGSRGHEWRETRHDAIVGADDHGLGPDISPIPDFRGRGPKSYQRSDERLKEELSERLRDDPRIDASDITVDVTGGRVSLSGEVDSRRTKHQVEDLVDGCRGVQEIDNRLRIRAAGRSDGN